MPAEQRRSQKPQLLETYVQCLADNGADGYDMIQCRLDYRLSILVDLVDVVGFVTSVDFQGEREQCLRVAAVARVLAAVSNHEAQALLSL